MELFLELFPNPETLYYLHGYSGYEPFGPPKMMAGLEHPKPCLRSLLIFNENMVDGTPIEGYPIEPLAAFEKLEKIYLESGMLAGAKGERQSWKDFACSRTPSGVCTYFQLVSKISSSRAANMMNVFQARYRPALPTS